MTGWMPSDRTWPRARHDDGNSGRSGATGHFDGPPGERWRIETGGDVNALVALEPADDGPAFAALAGSVLQAFDAHGHPLWSLPRLPVTRVAAAGDLDGRGAASLLVRVGHRTLMLIDAQDGSERWRWRAGEGTFVPERGGLLLVPTARGHRLVICPTYATEILAFDLTAGAGPTESWRIGGPWDAGFGPSVIAADMDGDGTPELVLSSRLGHGDRRRSGRTTSAEVVLGRRRGHLYQAVHDLGSGAMLEEIAYAPVSRGHRCARPYGLLTAAPLRPGEAPSIVLVSCQVEEYLAVTGRSSRGRLRRSWGHFIEKDWPVDERELRVHPDSLSDIDADGRPELTVSLWEGSRWRTLILDPSRGWEEPLAVLEGRVFWGVLRGPSGEASLVLSVERARTTGGPTDLELRRGSDLEVVARASQASIVVSDDAPLPAHVAFMAQSRGAALVPRGDGSTAVVIRRWQGDRSRGLRTWSAAGGRGLAPLTRRDTTRVVATSRGVLIGSPDGSIRHLTARGHELAYAVARGRLAEPLVRSTHADPELVVDLAGGRTLIGRPAGRGGLRGRRLVKGTQATPLSDALGREHLVTVERGGVDAVLVRTDAAGAVVWRVPLGDAVDGAPLVLPDGRLAVTLRTGVHKLVTEIRAPDDGTLVARVDGGAYLRPPAVLRSSRGWRLVFDDHGVLFAIDADGRPRWKRDWTAAYTTPICGPFLPDGRSAALRAGGIHGVELVDAAGRRRWRREAALWTYDAGTSAVADLGADGLVVAMPRRDGSLDCLTMADGDLRWRLDLGEVEGAAVTAADLDGDGCDELVVGLADGRLLCVADVVGHPQVRWQTDLGAGISSAWLADLGRAAGPEIVAATVDGAVRILAPGRGMRDGEIGRRRGAGLRRDRCSGGARSRRRRPGDPELAGE